MPLKRPAHRRFAQKYDTLPQKHIFSEGVVQTRAKRGIER